MIHEPADIFSIATSLKTRCAPGSPPAACPTLMEKSRAIFLTNGVPHLAVRVYYADMQLITNRSTSYSAGPTPATDRLLLDVDKPTPPFNSQKRSRLVVSLAIPKPAPDGATSAGYRTNVQGTK